MSLLILGEANRSATFEGSRWLFDGTPIGPTITTLNTEGPSFFNHPITHVMLTDYMLTRGADVGWFGATTVVKPGMYEELDTLGERVYAKDGVTIWALDQDRTAGDGRREFASKSALTLLTDRFFGTQMRGFIFFESSTRTTDQAKLVWHVTTPVHVPIADLVFDLYVAR